MSSKTGKTGPTTSQQTVRTNPPHHNPLYRAPQRPAQPHPIQANQNHQTHPIPSAGPNVARSLLDEFNAVASEKQTGPTAEKPSL